MRRVPVVVTGIGIICPLGRDAGEYWTNLVAGKNGVTAATTSGFDALGDVYAGAVPDEWITAALPDRDTSERVSAMALVAAKEAFAHAGLGTSDLQGHDVAVVVGQCQGTPGSVPDSYLPFHEACDRVADEYGLVGPRSVISTACAAGGNAVGTGRDMLWDGTADVVLAGGVDSLQVGTHLGFALLQAISPGPTRPYSTSEGLSLGEGAAFLVLETQEQAQARGATILAEVAGYGLSADAYHATAPDPTGRGALRAVRRALGDAGLEIEDISYVNGHGTGTPTNDRMERKAMKSLFGERVGEVPISSTKSALGHSLGASGAIEAVTCVLALENATVPPTIGFDPDAGPDADGMDFVPNKGRPADVEVTVSNNYAFGGNNCSLVLSKPGRLTPRTGEVDDRQIVISGIGVVSGFGLGLEAWRKGVENGASAIGKITSFDAAQYGTEYGVEPFQLGPKPLAASGLWRHMDEYGKHSLAATTMAWADAGLKSHGPGRDDVGLVFATGYGPIRTAAELARGMADPDGEGASALSFSNVTVNAAAGAVCQAMKFRGPTTTIASGGASALVALDAALALLKTGQAERILLLAIDDLCEPIVAERSKRDVLAADGVSRPYDTQQTGTVLGAASVALLLEPMEAVRERGGKAYAEVGGVSHIGNPDGDEALATERALRRLLERTGTDAADVDYYAGWASGTARDTAELTALSTVFPDGVRLSAPKSLTGECEAASGGINLLVAALAVAEGLLPATAGLESPVAGYSAEHLTRPEQGPPVARAVAGAATPGALYASALLTSVR